MPVKYFVSKVTVKLCIIDLSFSRYPWLKNDCSAHSYLYTGTCFIQKIYVPSSSLLQGKYLPFSPSPLRLNIFRLFVILSLTQLYRYTPEIFLVSTATFKYTYRVPFRRIGQEYSANVAWWKFQSFSDFLIKSP